MILKLAWKHIKSRPVSGAITIVGITLVLTLLGCFWTLRDNLTSVQNINSEESATINIFIKTGTLNSEIKKVVGVIQSSPIVSHAKIVSSEEAFKEFENQFGETLSKAVNETALPAMIKATLKKGIIEREKLNAAVETFKKEPSVLEVDLGNSPLISDNQNNVERRVINWATVLFFLVLTIVALMISHIIRLAFEGSRDDIETLKVLGATKIWIFTPVLIEALFYGVASSFLTVIALNLCVQFLLPNLANFLLPKNFEIFVLSPSSWLGVIGVALAASLLGALMTWPLIQKSPRRV